MNVNSVEPGMGNETFSETEGAEIRQQTNKARNQNKKKRIQRKHDKWSQ